MAWQDDPWMDTGQRKRAEQSADRFRDGQWDAFDRVLNLLNTFDEKMLDKFELYKQIMELRP